MAPDLFELVRAQASELADLLSHELRTGHTPTAERDRPSTIHVL
jgi:hypothetical protein